MMKILKHISFLMTLICWMACCYSPLLYAQNEQEAMQIFAQAEKMRKSNNFLSSIDIYAKAIEIDPINPRFYFSKGLAYFKLKDYENAALTLQETIRLKPDFVPAYTLSAQCFKEMNQPRKVIENMEKAYSYEDDEKKRMDYKMRVIGNLYEVGDYEEALKQIIDVKYLAPNLTDVLYYEGAIYNQQENHVKAKEILSSAIAKLTTGDPRVTAKFYYELGLAHYKLREYREAQDIFTKANFGPFRYKIAKMSPQYYSVAAKCFIEVNDLKSAKESLKKVLEIEDNIADVHLMLSRIAQREADHTKAIDELKKALTIVQEDKKKIPIIKELVELEVDNARYQDAVKTAEDYLSTFPKDFEMHFMKGSALYLMGDLKLAALTMEDLTKQSGIEIMSQFKFQFLLGLIYRDLEEYILAEQSFKKSSNAIFKQVSEMEIFDLQEKQEALFSAQ